MSNKEHDKSTDSQKQSDFKIRFQMKLINALIIMRCGQNTCIKTEKTKKKESKSKVSVMRIS